MHTGNGKEYWMRESAEDLRQLGLADRSQLSEDELDLLEIEFPHGGGKTNPWTYVVSTEHYITNPAVRSPRYVDIREARKDIDGDL